MSNVTALNGTQASLLGFLHEGPKTGWQILDEIAGGLGRFWNVTQSHAYRELNALEEQGLIAAGRRGPRERRPFAITAKGRAAFAKWIDREPGPEQIRFPLLVSLWFGEHLGAARLARFVDAERRVRRERLARYRAIERGLAAGREHPHRRDVVRFGIRYEAAILRWLAELRAEAKRGRARRRTPSVPRRRLRHPAGSPGWPEPR